MKLRVVMLVTFLTLVIMVVPLSSLAGSGDLQDYPSEPIKVVVPAGPGGGTDVNARLANKYLSKELGVELVVANISGAGGSIATREVKNSNPDGYTVLFQHEGMIMNEMLEITDYGPTDFEVAGIPVICDTLTLAASNEYKSLEHFIEEAKKNPGELEYAMELGSTSHMVAEAFQDAAGIKFKAADVGGQSDKIAALMGGHIDVIYSIYGGVQDYFESGDFVSLGILSEERSELLPDVPTFKEQGVDISFDKYWMFAFPPGTPKEIVDKFSSALEKVTQNEEYREDVKSNMNIPRFYGPEDAVDYIKRVQENMYEYKDVLIQ